MALDDKTDTEEGEQTTAQLFVERLSRLTDEQRKKYIMMMGK